MAGPTTPPRGFDTSSGVRPYVSAGVSPYLVREAELLLGSSPAAGLRRGSSPTALSGRLSSAGGGNNNDASPAAMSSARASPRRSPLRRPGTTLQAATHSPVRRSPSAAGKAPRDSRDGPHTALHWTHESREGRLTTLLTEFDQRSLRPWTARVADIATRFTKLNFVAEEELRFLRHVRRRNEAFLHSVRSILREAVAEGVGVDGHLAKQARDLAAECADLNDRIVSMLRHANKPSATDIVTGRSAASRMACSRSNSADVRSTTTRGHSPTASVAAAGADHDGAATESVTSAAGGRRAFTSIRSDGTPASRTGSPSRSRVAAVLPVPSLAEMQRPAPRRVASPPPAKSVVSREDRRRMLEGIVALEKRSSLTPSDLEWAESIFARLYGPAAAPQKFQEWCHELANTPLVVRPSYYGAGRAPTVSHNS
jgi:hypothetical protein